MTKAESIPRSTVWPRLGWWVAVLLVMALQLGFIFTLGRRSEAAVRPSPATPPLQLRATEPSELLALRDPTLFMLPHREAFSGQAWLKIPSLSVQPYRWTEPDQWLALQEQTLGDVFHQFMQTNDFVTTHLEMFPEPQLSEPNIAPAKPLTTRTTLQVKGDLAGRTVIAQPGLPAMPGTDLLANSIVQVMADAGGNVLSVILLSPGSGSADADQRALDLAKLVRFAPQKGSHSFPNVTLGTLVFAWQTVPATNTDASQ